MLATGDMTVTVNNDTGGAFKACALFSTFKTEINDVFIAMPMYNLIEYSDNYSYTSRSLW